MMGDTLDTLIRRFRGGMSENDADFFTDQAAIDWANEAQDVVATRHACTAPYVTETWTVKGAALYLLDDDMLSPTAASIRRASGVVDRLDYTEPDNMDQLRTGTTRTSYSFCDTCTYRTYWDGRAIEVYPTPNVTGLSLYVRGNMRPRTLVNPTDRSDIPAHLSQVIVKYMLWQAKIKDEEPQQAQLAEKQFQNDVLDLEYDRRMTQFDQFNRTKARRMVGGRGFRRW